jgi:hypothetical protein
VTRNSLAVRVKIGGRELELVQALGLDMNR